MDNPDNIHSDFIFYQSNKGKVKISVAVDEERETIWVTQKSMAEIFDIDVSGITKHIKNIFETGELEEISNVQKMHIASSTKPVKFYNLDVIISVGYRVNSYKATQFRIWASSILKEYMVKGFALDDDRLKQGKNLFGKDYFDELLEKIRYIRNSERRFYLKLTDLFREGSIDYDKNASITKEFYATVQNKLHWAIHQHTAAELISKRADATKPFMGLTSYKNSETTGKVLKSDTEIAKNYLTQKEIDDLNRLVSMYLDFAENMAKRNKIMKMKDWNNRLNSFLQFNEYEILDNLGQIKSDVAKKMAHKEFEKFRIIQDSNYISDFEETISEIKATGNLPSPSHDRFSIKNYMKKMKDKDNK
ncbi:hypothetical protein CLV91_0558 [Maribacter vaceletii]|uniref:Bro-N domain-containing protein n=1 Tax=Maribacter vaceletii TaxID=1206816 RepID=A0A495ECT4_9FLAO|nr:hypothetical protein CLV91_0558 [Maribacter vaceletii]